MLLSIIVPVYNVRPYLQRCLQSLAHQGFADDEYEILIINDGSDDGSLGIAEDFAASHRNARLISQDNQGLSAARNAGISAAGGSYLLFVDSDDYVANNVLSDTVGLAIRLNAQVLAFDHLKVNDADVVTESRRPYSDAFTPPVVSGIDYLAKGRHTSEAWAYLYQRDYLMDLGLRFEVGRFLEDILFTAEVVASATRVAHCPIDVYRYVQRSDSIMQKRNTAHAMKLIEDMEHVVVGLGDLHQRWSKDPRASAAFLQRLYERQQSYVFFMIVRFIRSDIPLKPSLSAILRRLRAIHVYPMDQFPWRDFRRPRYRVLATIFNHGFLLWPFAYLVRGTMGVRAAVLARV